MLYLQGWFRHVARARAMGVQLPDGSVLLSQVAFRLSLTRHTLRLDYQSEITAVEEYARTLLAEFEVLALSGNEGEGAPKRQGVRRMDGSNPSSDPKTRAMLDHPKAPPTKPPPSPSPKQQQSAKPCNKWLSASACKFGARCTFGHDMEAEALQGRCFYCSSAEHWANSCPIKLAHKAEEKAQAGGSVVEKAGGKEPKGKGKGYGGKTGSRVKNLGAEETPSVPPPPKVAATAVGSNDPTSALASKAGPTLGPSQAQLVQEATEVLRSLRLKKVTGPGGDSHVVRQVVSCQGFGLIDSGATSALRQGTRAELESAVPVEVQLAVGSTTMHVNAQGTLLTPQPVQPILPTAALPRLGCTIQWSDVGLSVRHPTCGLLPVRLNDTSPELPAPLLLRLIGDYEQLVKREVKDRQSRERLWKVLSQVASDVVDPQAWLEHHVRAGTLDATSLHVWVRAAFPALPERIASRIACEPCCEPERVPFNRRT